MKKLNFKKQMIVTVTVVALGVILSHLFKTGIFSNAAWIIVGLLWVINPVVIHDVKTTAKGYMLIRLSGFVIVILGLVTRFGV